MANIQSPSQRSTNSTLNPIGIKTFNNKTTGTGVFDTTAGNVNTGNFSELNPLSNSYGAEYTNGFNSYPTRTLNTLLTKIMTFFGLFII